MISLHGINKCFRSLVIQCSSDVFIFFALLFMSSVYCCVCMINQHMLFSSRGPQRIYKHFRDVFFGFREDIPVRATTDASEAYSGCLL